MDASKLLVAGKNTVLIDIQSRLGGDSGRLGLSLWHNSPLAHATWHFHGGLDDLDETAIIGRVTDWSDFLSHRALAAGRSALPGSTHVLEMHLHLSPGAGHVPDRRSRHYRAEGRPRLAQRPQPRRVAANVPMYMPECWIKEGANDLVVLDIYGNKPDQLKLTRYEAFAVSPPSHAH